MCFETLKDYIYVIGQIRQATQKTNRENHDEILGLFIRA